MTASTNNNKDTTMMVLSFLLGASCTVVWNYYYLSNNKTSDNTATSSSKKRRQSHKSSSKKSNPSSDENTTTTTSSIPTSLREEQLSRHELFFGKDGLKSIQNAKVCVVGLGGVGSHTAIMLARGGVEYLRLIDFDQVTLSSLNRHACATLHDVGIPKVQCVQTTCHALGLTKIDAKVEMYTEQNGPSLLALPDPNEKWDLIIDCIDDVPTKAALLSYCLSQNIRVFSCMGAGGKCDMTRLHISDLRTAAKDPLASKLRQTMKKTKLRIAPNVTNDEYLDDMDQLTIIYSSEKPVAKLADLTDEQKAEQDKSATFGAVDNMRIRVLPVLGPMPAIMGQSLASTALCELGQKPIHQPVTGERLSKNVRNKLFQHLKSREKKITVGTLQIHDDVKLKLGDESGGDPATNMLDIDSDDVDYLLGIWRNRCAVTGARLGTVLSLVRWDYSKPAAIDNLVLMSTHAKEAYDEKGKAHIPANIQERIEKRLSTCRDINLGF